MANKNLPGLLPLAQTQPGAAINICFQLSFPNGGEIVNCPPFQITPGMVVTLRPINTQHVNEMIVWVADYPEALNTTSALVVAPGTDVTIPWPIENTAQIWATGSEQDGLQVFVQKQQVG